MSITVSAVIAPSRLLRLALCAQALACVGAALWLVVQPSGFYAPLVLAGACLLAGVLAAQAAWADATVRRIDLSGPGEIRLLVQHSMGAEPAGGAPASPWQLVPGSTLWPDLLVLLLRRAPGERLTVVRVLPDSLPAEQFRKLAVALRAIAGRDDELVEKHKIL